MRVLPSAFCLVGFALSATCGWPHSASGQVVPSGTKIASVQNGRAVLPVVQVLTSTSSTAGNGVVLSPASAALSAAMATLFKLPGNSIGEVNNPLDLVIASDSTADNTSAANLAADDLSAAGTAGASASAGIAPTGRGVEGTGPSSVSPARNAGLAAGRPASLGGRNPGGIGGYGGLGGFGNSSGQRGTRRPITTGHSRLNGTAPRAGFGTLNIGSGTARPNLAVGTGVAGRGLAGRRSSVPSAVRAPVRSR